MARASMLLDILPIFSQLPDHKPGYQMPMKYVSRNTPRKELEKTLEVKLRRTQGSTVRVRSMRSPRQLGEIGLIKWVD